MDKLFSADTHMTCALKRADVYVQVVGLSEWEVNPFAQNWQNDSWMKEEA